MAFSPCSSLEPSILAVRTRVHIYCCWRTGSMQMIGVLLVSHCRQRNPQHQRQSLISRIGAFVAAPVGGLLWAAVAFALRVGCQWVQAKRKGQHFDAFDRPPPPSPTLYTGRPGSTGQQASSDEETPEDTAVTTALNVRPQNVKLI